MNAQLFSVSFPFSIDLLVSNGGNVLVSEKFCTRIKSGFSGALSVRIFLSIANQVHLNRITSPQEKAEIDTKKQYGL